MHRINTATAGANVNGTGKAGFLDGVVPTTPPTQLNASWFNDTQEEICNVITDAQITLVAGTQTQLLAALNQTLKGFATTVGASGTTTLTASSMAIQVLTGSSNQTFKLPDETLISVGRAFQFLNVGTGILTVVDSASSTILTILPDSTALRAQNAFVISTSAGASTGNWCYAYGVPGQQVGVNTNTAAAAGCVGETLTESGSGSSFASATPLNMTASPLVLTPGDWDVRAIASYLLIGTGNAFEGTLSLSNTSATVAGTGQPSATTGQFSVSSAIQATSTLTGSALVSVTAPSYQVLVATGTTVTLYCVGEATSNPSGNTYSAWMQARRMR